MVSHLGIQPPKVNQAPGGTRKWVVIYLSGRTSSTLIAKYLESPSDPKNQVGQTDGTKHRLKATLIAKFLLSSVTVAIGVWSEVHEQKKTSTGDPGTTYSTVCLVFLHLSFNPQYVRVRVGSVWPLKMDQGAHGSCSIGEGVP